MGGSSSGGSSSGGSSGGTSGTSGGSSGGSSGAASGGSSASGRTDGDPDPDEEDDDPDDEKDDCDQSGGKIGSNFVGLPSSVPDSDGRVTLAAGPGGGTGSTTQEVQAALAKAAAAALSASSAAVPGYDTYEEAEQALRDALDASAADGDAGLNPNVGGGAGLNPSVGSHCDPQGNPNTPNNDPMHALDDVPDYRPGIQQSKDWAREVEEIAKKNPLTEDLTAEDAWVIAKYTGSWASDLNKYLRGGKVPGSFHDPSAKVDLMDDALSHLPPVPDLTVYRGTFMPDNILQQLLDGDPVTFPEYLSTSTDLGKAETALGRANGGGMKGEKVLLEIETSNGRNVDPLSRYRGKESEVLIPRDGKFEMTSVETRVIDGKEVKVVKVKQTG
ncbi:ADP-ribosyltransferase [Streptomyces corynorhini]|uniref:ADP-ribosyltransferase n=1 Tax=Streptomyces corynorhini TaxID=2282652 RepID=UPI000E0926CD|nr:ADP-ribosyltransferase [Streptomyces corynorhini]